MVKVVVVRISSKDSLVISVSKLTQLLHQILRLLVTPLHVLSRKYAYSDA